MALISKIRKNSWLLVVLIALGLIGFIVMDMTSGQQSIFGSSQLIMGEIEGKKVDWNQFNRTENVLYGNSGADVYARRDALWNYYIEEAIVQKEAEALGLGVSKTELLDLEFGPNPSPIIQERFRNPTTQMLDRERLNQFKTAIETGQFTDPSLRSFWAHQEKEIIKDRLQSKMAAIITRGMYTPTWQAEMGARDRSLQADLLYVKIPFDEIDNTEVSISDSDIEQYLNENRARYETKEEARVIEYVTFDVEPTEADSARWRNQIAELVPQFETTDNDSSFVERNLGIYDAAYLKKEEVAPAIADTVFQMPVGSVYGPYTDANFYKAVKVLDRKVVPDSVRSRHILIGASDAITLAAAQSRVDSLKNLIETGQSTFDTLAMLFGSDATRTKGGDLGYAFKGQMVKPFNDLIFFEAEENKLYTVVTQFGAHLVEVTGRKYINNETGVKLAYLQQAIVPSEETQNQIYDKAFAFVGSNKKLDQLRQSVSQEKGLTLETAPMVQRNGYILGELAIGDVARNIIRWAFEEANKGDVSREVYTIQDPVEFYNSKYVVAGLKSIVQKGLPSVEAIRPEIEPLVINEKKGEIIAQRIKGKSLSAIAAEFDVKVDTASALTFELPTNQDLALEPRVIGTVFSMKEGQSSDAIVGTSGVFVVQVTRKQEPPASADGSAATAFNGIDVANIRQAMSASARAQVSFSLMPALRENADISDRRARFY